jgi:DNA-binding NtrC family response regulator
MSPRSPSPADPPILLVEDKDSLRAMLRHALEAQGHTVVEARDQPEAETALQSSHPAVVLSDLRLPEGDGFGVLRASKELDPQLPVIVMTAFGSIQDAVAAMKEGALDFLAKPVDPDHLLLMVERALAQRRLATENMLLREELAQRRGAPQIVGDDPKLKQVSVTLHRAAATDTTVLLEGESGTGKELFARALHALSPRADGPFVAINCAAIPETLLETELFGHEKGAFTGAANRKPGKFELAHRGTLFLDEIGDLPLLLQAKILRVLEERRFERVGGTQSLQVDVRVVAATNRDLEAMMISGEFREDLYYRLKVIEVTVPPLRERRGEITHLAGFFMDRYARRYNRQARQLSDQLTQLFQSYEWPGNIRELENMIKRIVILQDESLVVREMSRAGRPQPAYASAGVGAVRGPLVGAPEEPDDLVDVEDDAVPVPEEAAAAAVGSRLADVAKSASLKAERALIEDTLTQVHWNRRRAAEQLGVSYKTLLNKIKECGISRK